MKTHALTAKPALTAIAAVMALGTTPALAQIAEPAAPATQPEIVVPSAQPPAPTLPGAPVALPQISMPATPAAEAAPTPVAAPPLPTVKPQIRSAESEPVSPARAETAPAQRRASAERPARAPVETPAPVVERAAPASDLLNEPTTSPTDLRTGAAAAPAPQPSAAAPAAPAAATGASSEDDTALWVMGAGGAALLVGAGAFLFLRRRDRREDALDDGYAPTTAVRAPATIVAERKRPLAQPEPVAAAPAHPASAMPTIGTEPGAESPTATPALANGSFGERFPELEAMVAAPPSPENPFRTRAKRLRRAAFIHARSHAPKRADVTNDSAQAPAPVREAERQPVYNFGTTRSYRPKNWKPITT